MCFFIRILYEQVRNCLNKFEATQSFITNMFIHICLVKSLQELDRFVVLDTKIGDFELFYQLNSSHSFLFAPFRFYNSTP